MGQHNGSKGIKYRECILGPFSGSDVWIMVNQQAKLRKLEMLQYVGVW